MAAVRRGRGTSEKSSRWGGRALLVLLLLGLVFGSVGWAYVAVKHQQAEYGRQIEKLERAVLETEEEIQITEGRIATLLERGRLEDRLARAGSSLRPIVTEEVIELVVTSERPGQSSGIATLRQEGGEDE